MDKLTVFSVLIVVFCSCAERKASPDRIEGSDQSDSVKVFALHKDTVSKSLKLPAVLHPWERAEIFAKVEGYVKELQVDIGDNVKKNDILLILDAPEVAANYAKASADLQASCQVQHKSRYVQAICYCFPGERRYLR